MEKITYKKSLAAKLVLNQDAINAYQSIKDLCATRKRITTRMSFGKETITYGRTKIGVIKINVKNINLHLALDVKKYENSKYNFKDMSQTKSGQDYPLRITIKGPRSFKHALELLEDTFSNANALDKCPAKDIDYKEIYYPRSIEKLIEEGLIKKIIKKYDDDELISINDKNKENISFAKVSFVAKTLFEATSKATDLYLVLSTNNWDVMHALKMNKEDENTFRSEILVPKNTHLEFKICRSNSWADVEKGIWKEEIKNHSYYVTKDIIIEDLIHNFRED